MKSTTSIAPYQYFLFYGMAIFSILTCLLGFYFEEKALLILPGVLVVAFIGIVNFRFLYFLLLAMIPLSIEFDVSSTLATDLPTEPLMAGLMLIAIVHLLKNAKKIDFSFFVNPIMVMLIIHLFWIFFTSCTSLIPSISFKFLLAKLWYISAFLVMTAIIVKDKEDVKKVFWCIYIPLTFTITYTMARHALTGFSFDAINPVLRPFYRNHVNYAAIVVVFFPWILFAKNWYSKGSWKKILLTASLLLYAAAIYFSYTRACYLALIAVIGAYFIFRFRLAKIAIVASIIGVSFIIGFITYENHYLQYSPSTSTVSQHELGDLIDATFKAEDVSSMERIYRWIAGAHMAADRPVVGFGPNGFVPNYKNYTVFIFETWISENEENSGVHNYFLMTLVEQGIFGLLIFIGLLIAIFTYGEKIYHQIKDDFRKQWIMASLLSLIAILVNLVFSDMIEVDKTGSFFFMNIAFIILLSRDFKGILQK